MKTFAPMLGKYEPQKTRSSPDGTVISIRHRLNGPLDRETAEEKLRRIFKDVAPGAMIDHVMLGHLKGAIQSGEGVFAISVTREDILDETANEAWRNLRILREGEITLNLLSVLPVPVTEQELIQAVTMQF